MISNCQLMEDLARGRNWVWNHMAPSAVNRRLRAVGGGGLGQQLFPQKGLPDAAGPTKSSPQRTMR